MPEKTIIIEMFPAGNGDAMLLSLGGVHFLIDAGYPSTYHSYLKDRLKRLGEEGGRISHFIITHVDADHISGAIPLLLENGHWSAPEIIPIDQIWHNSYRHLQFAAKEHNSLADNMASIKLPAIAQEEDADISGGNVSYRQGSTLGGAILKGEYPWNIDFQGQSVSTDTPLTIKVGDEIKLTLLGPAPDALRTLGKKWLEYLRRLYSGRLNENAFFDDAFEILLKLDEPSEFNSSGNVSGGSDIIQQYLADWEASRDEDVSVTNGSSITFLLTYGGKKMLFLGDAIPSQVLEQLQKIMPAKHFPWEMDVLKVAHHGGFTNNSPELLRSIRAKHYLFSSNGKRYRHPHLETIAWLLHQNQSHQKKLYFNYQQERLAGLWSQSLKEKYNYEIYGPDGLKEGYVRLVLH